MFIIARWVNVTARLGWGNVYEWERPVHYCMDGKDTIIGSFIYSKMRYCGGAYHGALRDDGGKVYYIPADSVNELLIYDFTVKNGIH